LCLNCKEKIKKDYIFCPFCGIKTDSNVVQNEKESEILEQAIESYTLNEDEALINKLKEWRWKKAKEKNIPAYCVIQNKSISEIVKKNPTTSSELEKIYGIGNRKIKQYGEELLSIITQCRKINNNIAPQQNEIFSEDECRYKILGCLKEMKFTPRRTLLCEILKGSLSEKTSNMIINEMKNYEETVKSNKYFGILYSYKSEKILSLINHLMEQGYIENYDWKRDFGDPFIRLASKGTLFLIENSSK
jgi:ribonuclease D